MEETKEQFEQAIHLCRELYKDKLSDYKPSWRIMRPESITDQLYIKARRIRSIETKKLAMINDDIKSEFIAIVNYGVMGLIQLSLGFSEDVDITSEKAIELYDEYIHKTTELFYAKNHDYDEAWRTMRISSYTDFILTKLNRIKEIEENEGQTAVSEGIDSNYMDIINYALFGVIKLTGRENKANVK